MFKYRSEKNVRAKKCVTKIVDENYWEFCLKKGKFSTFFSTYLGGQSDIHGRLNNSKTVRWTDRTKFRQSLSIFDEGPEQSAGLRVNGPRECFGLHRNCWSPSESGRTMGFHFPCEGTKKWWSISLYKYDLLIIHNWLGNLFPLFGGGTGLINSLFSIAMAVSEEEVAYVSSIAF